MCVHTHLFRVDPDRKVVDADAQSSGAHCLVPTVSNLCGKLAETRVRDEKYAKTYTEDGGKQVRVMHAGVCAYDCSSLSVLPALQSTASEMVCNLGWPLNIVRVFAQQMGRMLD